MRNRKQSAQERRTTWVWEFSKRLVIFLAVAYFIIVFYAAAVMAITRDLTALTQLISDNAEVLKVCVFGYFAKAGVENAFKIKLSRYDTPEQPAEEAEPAEQEEDNETY